MSGDGSTIAVGGGEYDGDGNNIGRVKIFRQDGPGWLQLGEAIEGELDGNRYGRVISLSGDGNIIAIGVPGSSSGGNVSAGNVRIYSWDGQAWTKLGADIGGGEADGDNAGFSVALSSDGLTVVMGAANSDGNGHNAGNARIFSWDGQNWNQIGGAIEGEEDDRLGHSVAISDDGTIVAVGAPSSDYLNPKGYVSIYSWTGQAWSQLGSEIDGEADGDRSGQTISISGDGTTVAIGTRQNAGNGYRAGHTRIFNWDGSNWNQRGDDIDGEKAYDDSGHSVSLSGDGTRVAIGTPGHDEDLSDVGSTRIYGWDGTAWGLVGGNISGDAKWDGLGYSVSLSDDGSTVIAGGPVGEQARVYQFGFVPSGLHLGSVKDEEFDGVPSNAADSEGSDDDGVTFGELTAGLSSSIDVSVTGKDGFIDAWIDWNADGDWDDDGEKIFDTRSVVVGTQTLSLDIPVDATIGTTFARFRLSSTGGLDVTGLADDGEVEDYAIAISAAPDEPPVITLLGESPYVVEASSTASYSDPGVTAADPEDGDLTGSVSVSGQVVNLSAPGSYVIEYDVADSAGNDAETVTRTVIVQDTLAPVITLAGDAVVNVNVDPSGTYSDPGATAVDALDGDVSASVVASGDVVDLSQEGSYTLTYNVSDNAGNAADQVTRTVNVSPVLVGGVTVLDDGEAGFAQTGFTEQSNAQVAAAYDSDVHHMQGGSGEASWTFTGLPVDRYQVSATWAYKYNNNYNAQDAPFTLSDGAGGVFSSHVVNQKNAPAEFEDGGYFWNTLDTVEVTGGTLVVTLGAGSLTQ